MIFYFLWMLQNLGFGCVYLHHKHLWLISNECTDFLAPMRTYRDRIKGFFGCGTCYHTFSLKLKLFHGFHPIQFGLTISSIRWEQRLLLMRSLNYLGMVWAHMSYSTDGFTELIVFFSAFCKCPVIGCFRCQGSYLNLCGFILWSQGITYISDDAVHVW